MTHPAYAHAYGAVCTAAYKAYAATRYADSGDAVSDKATYDKACTVYEAALTAALGCYDAARYAADGFRAYGSWQTKHGFLGSNRLGPSQAALRRRNRGRKV